MKVSKVSEIVDFCGDVTVITSEWMNKQLELAEGMPADLPEVHTAFNPGGIRAEDGRIILIVRTEFRTGSSGFVSCQSLDGLQFQLIPGSLMMPATKYESLEDARVVWFPELECYLVTYVVTDGNARIAFWKTDDFANFEDLGEVSFCNEPQALLGGKPNKDACLLPRKYGGEFVLLHRPEYNGQKDIWLSYSKDLKNWYRHKCIAKARHGIAWDNGHIGLSTQPLKIPREFCSGMPEGYLFFYHGVQYKTGGHIYRIGTMWLSVETMRITHRSSQWLIGPYQESFISPSDAPQAIFPCCAWHMEGNGSIVMYFGKADMTVGRCFLNTELLMKDLRSNPV